MCNKCPVHAQGKDVQFVDGFPHHVNLAQEDLTGNKRPTSSETGMSSQGNRFCRVMDNVTDILRDLISLLIKVADMASA